ncbi:MAG TPA: hypothetical protein VEM57_05320 [Candidatus Binatus sp.]|nr:hypothetical protein [Candidatus Binatus sp.]
MKDEAATIPAWPLQITCALSHLLGVRLPPGSDHPRSSEHGGRALLFAASAINFTRRAKAAELAWGSASAHRERVARGMRLR